MRPAAFRIGIPSLLSVSLSSSSSSSATARLSSGAVRYTSPPLLLQGRSAALFSLRRLSSAATNGPEMSNPAHSVHSSSSTAVAAAASLNDSAGVDSSMERQFEDFRFQLEESGSVRERIRKVVIEMEAAVRLVHSSLLLVHHSRSNSEVLEKAKAQIDVLKGLFGRLMEILLECPGQYYRYHGDWKSETQSVVSLISFLHWLETGNLLRHEEVEKKLGLDLSEFGLDIEDYLTGLCFMSNELPRYVVNQVTAGDYDCPKKVLAFLTDLHAAFKMLNLRNDFLRRKFDGMKYDLKRVEEVYYDVKIRGLASDDSASEKTTQV